jgi:hypothetical protein
MLRLTRWIFVGVVSSLVSSPVWATQIAVSDELQAWRRRW